GMPGMRWTILLAASLTGSTASAAQTPHHAPEGQLTVAQRSMDGGATVGCPSGAAPGATPASSPESPSGVRRLAPGVSEGELLTLDRALALALERSPRLRAAGAAVEQARAGVREARS